QPRSGSAKGSNEIRGFGKRPTLYAPNGRRGGFRNEPKNRIDLGRRTRRSAAAEFGDRSNSKSRRARTTRSGTRSQNSGKRRPARPPIRRRASGAPAHTAPPWI